jgi:hypothetical protein
MDKLFKILPIALYMIVGAISLLMAFKNLFSKRFLPFHEKAAGKAWNEIDDPMKLVILTFMRLAGLGFLVVSILLLIFPVVIYYYPTIFYTYSIPLIAFIFCFGLFIINFSLYRKTKAATPWKGSLYAMLIIIAGIIISIFN